MPVSVREESPRSPEARALLEELSAALERITGSSGRASFDLSDLDRPGAVFAVARGADGAALGCGALRPLGEGWAELKRIYAREGGQGVGSAVLAFLERRAGELGYRGIVLETRAVNQTAMAFYRARGYRVIENYGRYQGRAEAVCMGKHFPNLP